MHSTKELHFVLILRKSMLCVSNPLRISSCCVFCSDKNVVDVTTTRFLIFRVLWHLGKVTIRLRQLINLYKNHLFRLFCLLAESTYQPGLTINKINKGSVLHPFQELIFLGHWALSRPFGIAWLQVSSVSACDRLLWLSYQISLFYFILFAKMLNMGPAFPVQILRQKLCIVYQPTCTFISTPLGLVST